MSHGMADSPEYNTWIRIKQRCYNSNNQDFRYYGARGIRMSEAWRNDFSAFYAHVGPRPPKHSLDRIDNNGNYEPGNVRWVLHKEQCRNRRSSKLTAEDVAEIKRLRAQGVKCSVLAERFGVVQQMISSISNGEKWK